MTQKSDDNDRTVQQLESLGQILDKQKSDVHSARDKMKALASENASLRKQLEARDAQIEVINRMLAEILNRATVE